MITLDPKDHTTRNINKVKTQLFSHWGFGPGTFAIYTCPSCEHSNAHDAGWGWIKCHDCGVYTQCLGEYRDETDGRGPYGDWKV